MPCMIGTELESSVALAAKLHIASSFEELPYACEYTESSFQQILLKDHNMKIEDGCLRVPTGPGLGVAPDMDAVERGFVKL